MRKRRDERMKGGRKKYMEEGEDRRNGRDEAGEGDNRGKKRNE